MEIARRLWEIAGGRTKKIFFAFLNKVSNSDGFIQLQETIRETEFYSRFVVFNKLSQHLLDFA